MRALRIRCVLIWKYQPTITVTDKPKSANGNTQSPIPPLPLTPAAQVQKETRGSAERAERTGVASALPTTDDKGKLQLTGATDNRSRPPTAWSANASVNPPRKKLSLPKLRGTASSKATNQRSLSPGSSAGSPSSPRSPTSTSATSASIHSRSTGTSLRAQPINPRIHNRASIMVEAHAIEDDESRRLCELAFLD